MHELSQPCRQGYIYKPALVPDPWGNFWADIFRKIKQLFFETNQIPIEQGFMMCDAIPHIEEQIAPYMMHGTVSSREF
jgi:hypothetical protein